MKRRWSARQIAMLSFAAVTAMGVGSVAAQEQHQHGMMGDQSAGGEMMERCKSMMARHEEMKARLTEMDSSVDELLAQADDARGKEKVEALARALHEVVAEMRETRQMMAHGQAEMMEHMMDHMQNGMMQGASSAMESCPMMRAMRQEEGASGDEAHTGHHD